MSFILDALKKSENERQQSRSNEFAAVPTKPAASSFPRWLLLIGLLLAINLLVLIGLLLRQDTQPDESPRSNSRVALAREMNEPAAVDTPETALPSFRDQVAAARKKPLATQAVPRNTEPESDSAPDVKAVLISQNPSSVTERQLYPTLQEVRVSGVLDLPDLHLDIHVYSDVPKDRFVFINMAKHREGSRLDEGPQVLEITPDGVVLRYQGKSFLVPRE
ncbi:MAG TPA: general secretion pathway protein GspB [Woeseiaceae bacterium]|nr:general secretion pathway protein GspB [Woeseiaceae bacterium]